MVSQAQRSRAPIQKLADTRGGMVRAGGAGGGRVITFVVLGPRSDRRPGPGLRGDQRRWRCSHHRLPLRPRTRDTPMSIMTAAPEGVHPAGVLVQGRRSAVESHGQDPTPWWWTRPAPSPKAPPEADVMVEPRRAAALGCGSAPAPPRRHPGTRGQRAPPGFELHRQRAHAERGVKLLGDATEDFRGHYRQGRRGNGWTGAGRRPRQRARSCDDLGVEPGGTSTERAERRSRRPRGGPSCSWPWTARAAGLVGRGGPGEGRPTPGRHRQSSETRRRAHRHG